MTKEERKKIRQLELEIANMKKQNYDVFYKPLEDEKKNKNKNKTKSQEIKETKNKNINKNNITDTKKPKQPEPKIKMTSANSKSQTSKASATNDIKSKSKSKFNKKTLLFIIGFVVFSVGIVLIFESLQISSLYVGMNIIPEWAVASPLIIGTALLYIFKDKSVPLIITVLGFITIFVRLILSAFSDDLGLSERPVWQYTVMFILTTLGAVCCTFFIIESTGALKTKSKADKNTNPK